MPKFSKRSTAQLGTCHPDLVALFTEVIKHYDCTILEGHRNKEDQNRAFDTGRSQVKWPRGNHNHMPSLAVDAAPYPVDWGDRDRFLHFAGFVQGMGAHMGLDIQSGLDWDGDHQFNDQHFVDGPHFALRRTANAKLSQW